MTQGSERASWWEDPRLGLGELTPGHRYTLVLVVLLVVVLLKFGLPHETSTLRGAGDSSRSADIAGSTQSPAPGQGPQLPMAPSDLGTSSSSPSFLPPDASEEVPGALPGTANVLPAPGGSSSAGSANDTATPPAPATSSSACPLSPPQTGTPADSLLAALNALCEELLAQGSGTVPAGSLPGVSGSEVPEEWAFVDSPVGASGVSDPKWSPALSAEMTGKKELVTVGLVQSSRLSTSVEGTLSGLERDGALVQALLVPEVGATGGPQAFGSWVVQVLSTLKAVSLFEMGAGAAPAGSSSSTVAGYVEAGLAAARATSPKAATGVFWLDGGDSSGDTALWSSLDSTSVWSESSFIGGEFDAQAACSTEAGFLTVARKDPRSAALAIVSEAFAGTTSSGTRAADDACTKSSTADDGAALALWRTWQEPAS